MVSSLNTVSAETLVRVPNKYPYLDGSYAARLMGHELGDQTFGGYSDGVMFERLVDTRVKVLVTLRTCRRCH